MPLLVTKGSEQAVADAVRTVGHLRRAVPPRSFDPDPVHWIRDRLGEELWTKQEEIAAAVAEHRRVTVHSAHNTGKSWLAARLAAWWLSEHEPGEAFVVSTAPTSPQVRAILWREIARAHSKGQLPGRLNQTEWWMQVGDHEEIVGYGRKPAEYDPAAFQGIHARAVLIIIDEAAGVPESIYTAADTLTSNEGSHILAIGNPDDPTSHFAKTCQPDSGWHVIHVDGFASPNFTDEVVPEALAASLLSPVWVEEKRAEWGEDSALWVAKVKGLFPRDVTDGVIPFSWLKNCQQEKRWTPEQLVPIELGVDVGAGGDWTVVRERCGVKAGRTWRARTPKSQEACALIMGAIQETGASAVKVDEIGVGWGICGMLQELADEGKHKAQIVPVNVGQGSFAPEKFPKLRDQVWWELGRELSETGAWDLAELDDTTLAQLIAPKYRHLASGQIKIEPKEDTRKRLGRSPDDADALLLAYYVPPPEPVEGVLVYDDPKEISPV